MTRCCFTLLLSALVAIGGLVAVADEPPPTPGDAPLRLKKKPKPAENKPETSKADEKKPDEKRPDEKKDEAKEGAAPTQPEQDEKEVMERLSRNVRSVSDRLDKGELTGGTRQLQDDILKDIESLIQLSESSSQGGGQQDQNPGEQSKDQNQGDNSDSKNSKGKEGADQSKKSESQGKGKSSGPGTAGQGQGAGGRQTGQRPKEGKGRQRGQLARGNQRGNQRAGNRGGQPRPGDEQSEKELTGGKNPGDGVGGDKTGAELDRNADLNKQGVWGHVPESLRAAMNAYAGRQEFMAKHESLIKKYYSTIAAEGRRKGDRP